jgi:hypothetical protein
MGDMHAALSLACQGNVAFHHAGLGGVRHAVHAQPERGWAIIHGTADGHASILCVLHYRHIEAAGPPQHVTHDFVFENRLAIVADGYSAGFF